MLDKILLLCTVLLLASCGDVDQGYSTLEPGASYKLLAVGEAEYVPSIGQYISFHLQVYNNAGKKVYETNKKGIDRDEYIFYTHKHKGVIDRNLQLFKEGDSISFRMTDHLLEEQFPNFVLEDHSKEYNVVMKINHVERKDERSNRLDALKNQARLREELILDEFLKESNGKYKKWQGLYLHVIKNGLKPVKKNDHLSLAYKAYTLDGRLFDQTTDSTRLKYSFGELAQVIDGISLVVSKLGIGSESEVVIPSSLAFGEGGSMKDVIAPYTPLRYELQVMQDTTLVIYD